MFTGIVEEIGTVAAMQARGMVVKANKVLEGVQLGDSIAVNGACLTVTHVDPAAFTVGLMPETLRRTNIGKLRVGDPVHLERALAAGGRMGGHFVQGHVDGTGRLLARWREDESIWLRFSAPPEVARYTVAKGFIAIDGVSLTVVDCDDESFSVALVMYTQENVTLADRQVGYVANLEADVLGKYVEKFVRHQSEGITEAFLAENGFS
jgi:riboflavin synthase